MDPAQYEIVADTHLTIHVNPMSDELVSALRQYSTPTEIVWKHREYLVVSFDMKLIRQDQEQCRNGEAC